MRVLHILNGLYTGGTEMTLYKVLSGMNRDRFEPVVVSLMAQGPLRQRIEALGVPVHALGIDEGKSWVGILWRLTSTIRSLRPHLIQGWTYQTNLAATVANALTLAPTSVLWNIRHTPYDLRDESRLTSALIRLGKHLSHSTARIIYNAQASAAYHRALGYAADRQAVIPNGFDLLRFAPSTEARISVRSELGIGQEAQLIGLVARFHPMKDHRNFLRAAAILTQKRSNVHFLLAGRGVDNSNKLVGKLVQDNGLAARTHLLGERQDIPRLIAAFDIASSSSAWGEGFPNVIGEAMACGVPCVVTDIGDSAYVVGQTGLVVPPRAPQLLAEAWEAMLALGADERRRLGTQARQRVEKCFSVVTMVRAYEDLYEKVICEKERPFARQE